MTAISMAIDRDALATSLGAGQDLIRTLNMADISPEDQEIVMVAQLMRAAIARRKTAAQPAPPDFCYSQVEAARIVCSALGLEPDTFRANKPWLLLQKRHLGEGVGFFIPTSKKTGKPSTRLRQYSQEAIDYLVDHWDLTRFEIG